jgi:hypothetical protein
MEALFSGYVRSPFHFARKGALARCPARLPSAIRSAATGARITGKAAALLVRQNGRYALATQCIGGAQGIATVLERI